MQRYDPLEAPNPEEWLKLDEQERIDLVRDYHRRAGIQLPNEKLHATLHTSRPKSRSERRRRRVVSHSA